LDSSTTTTTPSLGSSSSSSSSSSSGSSSEEGHGLGADAIRFVDGEEVTMGYRTEVDEGDMGD